MHLIFLSILFIDFLLLIFIDHQSHRSSVNNIERNWHYHKESSSTNDYCESQDISYYQPANYNKHQQYRLNITT